MLKCENCYHYEACRDFTNFNFTVENCNTFKNKSLIVELPYSIGDAVYILNIETIHIGESEIKMGGNQQEWDISDFGETVFFNREEAENALKEKENDN